MEKMTTEGLALEELEAHAHAGLLPDRVEMRRGSRRTKRVRSGNVGCKVVNVAGGDVWAWNDFQCQRITA
jgi:hypothetical protein